MQIFCGKFKYKIENNMKVTKKDIMDVVLVHNAAFRVFFLSELGDSLLKLFYSSYLKVNSTVILVAKKDGKVEGSYRRHSKVKDLTLY